MVTDAVGVDDAVDALAIANAASAERGVARWCVGKVEELVGREQLEYGGDAGLVLGAIVGGGAERREQAGAIDTRLCCVGKFGDKRIGALGAAGDRLERRRRVGTAVAGAIVGALVEAKRRNRVLNVIDARGTNEMHCHANNRLAVTVRQPPSLVGGRILVQHKRIGRHDGEQSAVGRCKLIAIVDGMVAVAIVDNQLAVDAERGRAVAIGARSAVLVEELHGGAVVRVDQRQRVHVDGRAKLKHHIAAALRGTRRLFATIVGQNQTLRLWQAVLACATWPAAVAAAFGGVVGKAGLVGRTELKRAARRSLRIKHRHRQVIRCRRNGANGDAVHEQCRVQRHAAHADRQIARGQ